MTALLDGMLAELLGGGWPEPPDTIPLRILGLHQLPADHDTIRQAFRTRMLAAHPDLRDDAETADANADVAELVWARDVLLRKVRNPVTTNDLSSCEGLSRNGPSVNGFKHYEPDRCTVCKKVVSLPPNYWNARWYGYWARRSRMRAFSASAAHDQQARADRSCESCGATFTPRRADGRYCSNACRQAAYR
jgi:hypothetical protein